MIRLLLIAAGLCIVAAGGLLLFHSFNGETLTQSRPAVEPAPPLQPPVSQSNLIIPITIPLAALSAAANSAVPPTLTGSKANPSPALLKDGQIDYLIDRTPLAFSVQGQGLGVTSDLNGTVHVTGKGAGSVVEGIGSLIGGKIGSQLQNIRIDQTVTISGNVAVQARPQMTGDWHVIPNLAGKVTLKEVPLSVSGVKLNIAREIQPLVDQTLAGEIAKADAKLRGDDRIALLARREWENLCVSRPLPMVAPGAPQLFVEVKPVAAVAAQPKIDNKGVHLLLGLRAQTRVSSNASKPSCPFPNRLELISGQDTGGVSLALPIDVPFTELNKLLTAQLAGKIFPEDKSGPATVKIHSLELTPSGKRLLLTLNVTVAEQRFFGLSASGDVYLWGQPVLDKANQTIKLTDIALDVQSQSAFGLLGAAASAAIPYITSLIEERAHIDLKPLAEDARARIAAAAKQAEASRSDVEAHISIDQLTLQDIAFDDKTLRVIGQARGKAELAILSLPAR